MSSTVPEQPFHDATHPCDRQILYKIGNGGTFSNFARRSWDQKNRQTRRFMGLLRPGGDVFSAAGLNWIAIGPPRRGPPRARRRQSDRRRRGNPICAPRRAKAVRRATKGTCGAAGGRCVLRFFRRSPSRHRRPVWTRYASSPAPWVARAALPEASAPPELAKTRPAEAESGAKCRI